MTTTPALEPTIDDIYAARKRLSPFLHPTPLLRSEWLSEVVGSPVYLKVESMQPTRAFKIRGALNALLRVIESKRGDSLPAIVTASAGNHGRAVAMAAELLQLSATVFTPASAPQTKKAAIRRHGAVLRDDPLDYDAAERDARSYAASTGAMFLSPYNHVDVIAGAGTIALEIVEELPAFDLVVVPIGGGGLASGVGTAIKSGRSRASLVGVEVEASAPFAASIARGKVTEITPKRSLADGLTGNLEPGTITFGLVRRFVDQLVTVSETDLRQAIRGLAAEEHLIAEGAGAAAAAAVVARRAGKPGDRIVVILTGGNIDLAAFLAIAAE